MHVHRMGIEYMRLRQSAVKPKILRYVEESFDKIEFSPLTYTFRTNVFLMKNKNSI